jgi:hypothetical protein
MSRVIIIEMPDKYQATAREVLTHIRTKYPDAGMLLSTTFQWWKEYRKSSFNIGQLPVFVNPDKVKVDELIEAIKNPQSYEERTK